MHYPNIILWSDDRYFSPYAMSVYVALSEKGVPFSVKPLSLDREEQQQQSYANISVTRRIPSLEIDGFHLSESSAIAEYLEEYFAPPEY